MKLFQNHLAVLFGVALCQCCLAEPSQAIEAESVLIRLIDEVDVPARAAGVLSRIEVVEGQHVKKGQHLAQIDDVEARLNQQRAQIELSISQHLADDDIPVRSAKKKLAFSLSDVGRVRRAVAAVPGSISAAQMDETELRLSQAELELEKAKRDLQMAKMSEKLKESEFQLSRRTVAIRKIASPLDGVVVEVVCKPGEWVEPGEKVLRIVRTDRLRAEGLVLAREVLGVDVGTPVTVSVDVAGAPSGEYAGEVVFVSPEISPVTGQVRIYADIDNQSGLLRPGLRPKMTIQLGKSSTAQSDLNRDRGGLNRRP